MQNLNKGISLVEALVGIALMLVVFVSFVGFLNAGIKIVGVSSAKVGAVALANEQMEKIRNLPYAEVGTVGGIPSGNVPQNISSVLNGINYTIRTLIQYVDDPADGEGAEDENGITADYKRVKVEVGWEGKNFTNPLVFVSDVMPKGMETNAGDGTLKINVFDAAISPVVSADVHIENSELVPSVSVDVFTNSQGKVVFPGAPTAASYKITVTKTGHSSAQTYDVTPENPNPQPGHLTILEGETTEASFSIDLVSTKTVKTFEATTTLPLIPFHMRGEKIIGKDIDNEPIYKYSHDLLSGGDGAKEIFNLEWDNYLLTIDGPSTGYDISEICPFQPFNILPDTNNTTDIILFPHVTNTFLVSVKDGSGNFIPGASARLYKTGYDKTVDSSATCGQSFFSPLSASASYTLEVTKTGYQNFSLSNISISGQSNMEINLSPL
ncbi:carboxypeptidase-like regulatory domain-containing protein [Patescibacteria group bacterium]|nr:carboxypeptidase-like regulatory domain-containing protein [Patescibacteria group bacterium]